MPSQVVIPLKPSKKPELPPLTKVRFDKAGLDYSQGYPYLPPKPEYLDEVYKIRNEDRSVDGSDINIYS
jgi:hypothetical protein